MKREELIANIARKGSFLCVGLDPDIKKIPAHLLECENPLLEFCKAIVDATAPYCVAYKPNLAFFESQGKELEAKRLHERVTYDVEMIRELGHCSGIENYSRYFDGREPGTRPYCLLDFFPKDFLLIIDESHVSVPQLHAM